MGRYNDKMIRRILFHIITFGTIFSIFFSDLDVTAFNEKYAQNFSEFTWLLIMSINPVIFYLIFTIWMYKAQKTKNIQSILIDGKFINKSLINFFSYTVGFLILILMIFLFYENIEVFIENISSYSILTRSLYGGIFEEYIFRFCIPNILVSFAIFKENHLKINITQATIFAILHNSISLLNSSPEIFIYAFVLNFTLSFVAYNIARKNGIEFAMLFHAITHLFIYFMSVQFNIA